MLWLLRYDPPSHRHVRARKRILLLIQATICAKAQRGQNWARLLGQGGDLVPRETGETFDDSDPLDPHTLQLLGFDDPEAAAYLQLLSGPVSSREVADELAIKPTSAGAILEALVRRGLANRIPGRPVRYSMTHPDWVLPALVLKREEETHQLQTFVDRLSRQFERSTLGGAMPDEYIQIVRGKDAVLAQLDAVEREAREELLAFARGPVLSPENEPAEEALRAGVRVRALWDEDLFEERGMMEAAREWISQGQEVRIAKLPAKLVIADANVACIYVTEIAEGVPIASGLVTRHPEVIGILLQLFELLWESAVVPFADREAGAVARTKWGEVDRETVVACLKVGMTDEAMARQLGVSRRTITRRVGALLSELGVRTRFQGGYRIRELDQSARGW